MTENTNRGGILNQRRPATLHEVPGGFRYQARFGPLGRKWITIRSKRRDEASSRRDIIVDTARLLVAAGHSDQAFAFAQKAAAARESETARELRDIAQGIAKGKVKTKALHAGKTFRQVGEWWTSGGAHRDYPDQIEESSERWIDQCAQRLEKAVYPVIGSKLIREVTRQDCDEVMRRLPLSNGKTKLSKGTRRQYALLMTRILNLAELAGYIDRSPIPRSWAPKPGPQKRFPILYPAEDRALLACTDIPLHRRIFYGFLHREACRRSEGANLQAYEIDLEHGTVSLDENKTNKARFWPLYTGVPEALAAWLARRGEKEPKAFVFTDENGGPLNLDHLAHIVRDDLRRAGLNRADLYTEGPNKGHFGTHCFRRSMVTRNMALGKDDSFIRRRTGHTTDELLKYEQPAQSFAELHLGDVDPLVLCIPELSPIDAIVEGLRRLSTPRQVAHGVSHKQSGRRDSNPRPSDPQIGRTSKNAGKLGPLRERLPHGCRNGSC